MKLTNTEFNLLNKIATQTKMDCWFSIRQDKDGNDYVYDLEEKKRMFLRKGIKQLFEGVTDYDAVMTNNEKSEIIDLLCNYL